MMSFIVFEFLTKKKDAIEEWPGLVYKQAMREENDRKEVINFRA
jgi:hypothetical protein